MRKFLRIVVGVFLLPLCIAAIWATAEMSRDIPDSADVLRSQWTWMGGGFVLWLVLWFMFHRAFYRIYVFGHEMTHALWGLAFGAKVRNLKVSARGGSVVVSKDNIFITLAPYFFPFYTMLALLVRLIVGLFWPQSEWALLWSFIFGLTWSFHVCYTVQSLGVLQPDCRHYGYFRSYVLILLFNVLGVGLWIAVSSGFGPRRYASLLFMRTEYSYYMVWRWSVLAFRWCKRFFLL